jgi:hypothetical protein
VIAKYLRNRIAQVGLTLAVAFSLVRPIQAFAVCELPSPPVCAEFFHRDAIFAGTVISSQHRSEGEDPGWFYKLKVSRVFRGVLPPLVQVFTEDSSGRFDLEMHQSYLLFAYSTKPDGLEIEGCGNSMELAKAGKAIHLLEEVLSRAKAGADGYLAGGVMRWDGGSNDPIAGVTISVYGDGVTHNAVTGKDGGFHIDLPVGKYVVTATSSEWSIVPYDLSFDAPDEVVIHSGGCAAVEFGADRKLN